MYPDGVVKSVGDVLLSRVSHGTVVVMVTAVLALWLSW